MNRLVIHSRADSDGTLHVTVPLGRPEANQEMLVTIEPVPSKIISQEEWSAFLSSTAGAWLGDFERPYDVSPECRLEFP